MQEQKHSSTEPRPLATFRRENMQEQKHSSTETVSRAPLKTRSRSRSSQSSTRPLHLLSRALTRGKSTSAIRFTCPHCSEVRFLNIPSFSLTNPRICRLSTTPCCESSLQDVLYVLEIP